MNKPWVGYLGSGLIFLAGILMIAAKSYLAGGLLFAVSIAGVILKLRMNRK
jgi:hypothetical protein